MAIEQSIYTCVRTRRDTQTAGFGYYSYTDGCKQLLQEVPQIKRASVSYAAPRNQEVWWSCADDAAARDREENENIRVHHPITFSYMPVEADGTQKAVFVFGKNLGRDIAKSRPGNILVNMIAADMSDIQGYPFSYYGAKELFVPYDTNYFYDNGAEVPPLLENPVSLTKNLPFTTEDILRFINDDRVDMLCSMFQILLDYNDPVQDTRQIILCDKKDNIIYWIAALSILMPPEIAKKFSFTTYSFLATRSDDITPMYEDTMLCGVYSPVLNGDEPDDGVTNYSFSKERSRDGAAVFDFDKGEYADNGIRNDAFGILIESAMDNNLSLLQEYHKFLINHTRYRGLDNDFLRGYSFYLLYRYPEIDNLSLLEEAYQFASAYASLEYMREIAEKLMALTVDCGQIGNECEVLLRFVKKVYQNSTAEEKMAVCNRYLQYLKQQLCDDTTKFDEFSEKRTSIKAFCDSLGVAYEPQFAKIMTDEEVRKIGEMTKKKWVLIELTEMMIFRIRQMRVAAANLYLDTGMIGVFKMLMVRILSDEKNRGQLLELYVEKFDTEEYKVSFLEALYMKVIPAVQREILVLAFRRITENTETKSIQFLQALADKPLHEPVMEYIFRQAEHKSFEQIDDTFSKILRSNEKYREKYKSRMLECFRDRMLFADTQEEEMSNIYKTFTFAKNNGVLDSKTADILLLAYREVIFTMPQWYDLDDAHYEQFTELMGAGQIGGCEGNEDIGNLVIIKQINEYLATTADPRFLESGMTVYFDKLNRHEIETFVNRIAEYLYKCSVMEGSAFLNYQKLVPIPEETSAFSSHNMIIAEWMRRLVEEAPKKQQVKLVAELLVVMKLHCRYDCFKLVKMFRKKGIKYNDIVECYSDDRIEKIMRTQYMVPDGKKQLKELSEELQEAYDEERRNSPLGKLKSTLDNATGRFGFFKKSKDD